MDVNTPSSSYVAFHGQLYIGDCYVVLKTFWNDDSELDWEIYFWIGSDASVSGRLLAC